jgi:N-hydroxyarylamine O-acetyltransferase
VDGEAYLRRLGLLAPPPADLEGLRGLQRAHLEAVPFENSAVLRREPIVLDERRLVAKVVDASRGGFCFGGRPPSTWEGDRSARVRRRAT